MVTNMDISNIYNLSEEILLKYQENPFPDGEARQGLSEFAQRFKTEILSLPTPYVMALEGGYGVGKTYFITRFCEYLKKERFENDISVPTIYLNLWENDYVVDPFPVIVSQILYQLNPAKKIQDDITAKAIKITNNFIKFGAKNFVGVNVGDVLPLPNPEKDKQNVKAFKQVFKKMIDNKGGKIVLVVDEIDRCKPDYAVKALETIKHFFDIEGLFIILTTKLDFMDSICEAYYGHPQCAINMGEGYIQKFVQSKKLLNPIEEKDYEFIVKGIWNKDTLSVMVTKVNGFPVVTDSANVNAINNFVSIMSNIFYTSKLSIRKTIDICNEIRELIKRNSEELWKNKVTGYPEMMIIRYLKMKNILDASVKEPKVDWRFPKGNEFAQQQIALELKNLK